MLTPLPTLEHLTTRFPTTRYQGSKAKLANWIWQQLANLDFITCLDAFGGTGAVAYRLKQEAKHVTYNDLLRFNYQFGVALVENCDTHLEPDEVDWLLSPHSEIDYPHFVQDAFAGVYFTDAENGWIDRTITNIRQLANPYKFALAFYALAQACIIKRPYNLFHRKNLYVRLAEVERSFGNKKTWDTPFETWFRTFVEEVNSAVFDNGYDNPALNLDACSVSGEYDLVYLDPPYISAQGNGINYLEFYHFLEGLTMYDEWAAQIDYQTKHRRLHRRPSDWTDKQRIYFAFSRLFQRFHNSIIIVSYRSDGIPSQAELVFLLKQYKQNVRVELYGQYKYALSTNAGSQEILLIGT